METKAVLSLLPQFSIPEMDYEAKAVPSGYIHSSFKLLSKGKARYLLQKFNTTIFPEPNAVYWNFREVTAHLSTPPYRHYDWILTRDDQPFFTDTSGKLWRLFGFVPESMEMKQVETEQQAFSCGKLLGQFHSLLAKADPLGLKIPIADFQDPILRWNAFETALQSGITDRREKIEPLMQELKNLRDFAMKAPEKQQLRVCHNDTKLSNILFHQDTHEGLCFVDLDTVMPGYFYHDFGDLVRTVVSRYSEDHDRILESEFNEEFYFAIIRGIKSSGLELSETEVQSMTYGLVLMPFLHGIRALTDYLLGDIYYQVAHPEQNYNRGMNLLEFARSSLGRREQLDQLVRNLWNT